MTDDKDNKVVQLSIPAPRREQDADSHARADTERRQQLFDWADGVLAKLGLDKAIAAAKSIEALRSIVLDLTNAEIVLAIRDALHPAAGKPAAHFRGLKEGALKQILQNRFTDMKKTREAKLRSRRGGQPDWTNDLILDKHGKITPVLANLVLILCKGPEWKGVLAYDEFAAKVVIQKYPPLEGVTPNTPWSDHHDNQTRIWFQRKFISPAVHDVRRAVTAAAKARSFHPVRSRLNALVWDGTPRLETWPQTYLRAKDTPYIRAIAPRYLIAAVARVYEPGCQADNLIVLEGPQGKLKSTFLRELAIDAAWFADRLSNVGTKDAMVEVEGAWIIEIAELEGLKKAEPTAQKRFISSCFDRYRPPYGGQLIKRLRQCVFAGTINPPANGQYLRDPTGARRFWPIVCIGRIDINAFKAARDQLWAEAVHRYKAGEPWHLETAELEALAAVEQDKRLIRDPWTDLVREWIGDHRNDVSLTETLQELGLPVEQHTQSALNRAQKILTDMKFRLYRGPRPKREHRYRRDPLTKKDT